MRKGAGTLCNDTRRNVQSTKGERLSGLTLAEEKSDIGKLQRFKNANGEHLSMLNHFNSQCDEGLEEKSLGAEETKTRKVHILPVFIVSRKIFLYV